MMIIKRNYNVLGKNGPKDVGTLAKFQLFATL